jgi:hypothetical protein
MQKGMVRLRNWRTSLLLMLMLLSLVGLTACKPQQSDIPFDTIDRSDWSDSDTAYEPQEPTLIIIAQRDEAASLSNWITEEAKTALQAMDYSSYFALALFQGQKPSSGYSVQIDRIARRNDTVTVYAQFQEPSPAEEKSPEMTSPYQLVRVQKVGTWNQVITFNLVVDETIVVSLPFYVP